MDTKMLLDALYIVVMILLGGAALWFKGSGTVKGMVTALIAQAEYMYKDATKAGGVKFAWVVNKLWEMIPKPLRAVITKQMIETIVQGTFDAMEQYARMQADKLGGQIVEAHAADGSAEVAE